MKINALAHASINQLALIDLRIEPCRVPARHKYVMQPAPIDRFVYITKGKAVFFSEGEALSAGNFDMIYLPCEGAYRSQWQEDSEFMVIDLLLHDATGSPIRFGEKTQVLFSDPHGAYLGLLEKLAAIADSTEPFDWLERLSLSFKLLCEMARDTNRTQLDEHYRKIRVGLSFLQNNFTQDFSVEDLAKMCCVSSGSFRKSFAEYTGTSPVEYRNRLRIQKATELLKTGNYTVGEAAEAVGIRDIKYFSKLFKRYAGVSPSVIKNR